MYSIFFGTKAAKQKLSILKERWFDIATWGTAGGKGSVDKPPDSSGSHFLNALTFGLSSMATNFPCSLPNATTGGLYLNSGQNLELWTGLAHIRLPHPVTGHHRFL
jgi:hypothetical protein